MSFFIISKQLTTLFLSLSFLTTLSFDSEIISFMYGGGKNDVFFEITGKNKTLAIKPKVEGKLSNLLVVTKNAKYYFFLETNMERPHLFVEVHDGEINNAFKILKQTPEYDLLEGKSSILFINKKINPVFINQQSVLKQEYFSKGVPLISDGKIILN